MRGFHKEAIKVFEVQLSKKFDVNWGTLEIFMKNAKKLARLIFDVKFMKIL